MAIQYSTAKVDKLIHKQVVEKLKADNKFSLADLTREEALKLKYELALELIIKGI